MATHRVVRVLLAAYAIGIGVIGFWATIAPRSWYDDFPGLGRHWVAVDGPYNEHLARDVGALYLGLTALVVAAAVLMAPRLVQIAAAVNLIASAPHALYHVVHLDKYETADQVGNAIANGLTVVVPIVVLLMVPRLERATE